jgi:hypothetical protein
MLAATVMKSEAGQPVARREKSPPREIPGPYDPADMRRFLDTFLYEDGAFLVDEVRRLDADERVIVARMDTLRPLPISALQRTSENHPAHVSAAELLQATGSLGCMHAWFFYGCRWDEGWAGFGNRIHRADFKELAHLGPPLELNSRETRSRVGKERVVLRYEFRFTQQDRLVYAGDQTAMFVKSRNLANDRAAPARGSDAD